MPIMAATARELRIAEALAARLCHELVSPIGAIANGVEILTQDEGFAADASTLIGQSAEQASKRLQFYRLAYGALGEIAPETGRLAAQEFFAEGRCRCAWPAAPAVPSALVKVGMNLLLTAAGALPRGGMLELSPHAAGLAVAAAGTGARIGDPFRSLFVPGVPVEEIGPKTVQAVFTASLARQSGFEIALSEEGPDRVLFHLQPGPGGA
jgi:histidine phosphotransferase ChpT